MRNEQGKRTGIYYLATEIYPHLYTDNPEGEWQVKVFAADSPDGNFQPVASNPVIRGQRACLFQSLADEFAVVASGTPAIARATFANCSPFVHPASFSSRGLSRQVMDDEWRYSCGDGL